jgi:glycine/D-amino acid oxidase-like deaminating enzyme/nitrite reductase/ring-hydroxylating ferredoxin subunit
MTRSFGKHRSFWIDSTPASGFPALQPSQVVDVAIIGAGITGLTAAILLKRAGKTVAVLEARRVVSGVTGHTTAKITSSHGLIYHDLIEQYGDDAARLYAESNQAAIERIAAFVEEESIACQFERASNYLYSESAEDLSRIQAEVTAAQKLGLPASFVDQLPLPFPVAGALCFDRQAQFHPRQYLLPLAKAIPGDGSHLFEETRVLDVEEGDPCRVNTDRGTVTARDVIVATHIPIVDPGRLYTKVHPYRSYVLAAQIDRSKAPVGMFVSTEQPSHTIRIAPYGDAVLMIVAGEGHRVGEEPNTELRYQRLKEWVSSRFAIDSIEYSWSTQDYYLVDRIPYIGKLSQDSEHLYGATGFQGWGLTTGTVAGMILSDAILGRANSWADLYAAHRPLKPRLAAAKTFLKENVDVAEHWVSDHLPGKSERVLEDLAVGQGGIVRIRGEEVAAYRDEQGNVHTLSPSCTHLGCTVSWNVAEQSWDCPCHGSRFNWDGTVIHGPAVQDLERKELSE